MQDLGSFLTPIAQKPQTQKGEELNIISTQTSEPVQQKPQENPEFKPKEQQSFNDLFSFDPNNEAQSAQAYEAFAQNNGARTGFAYFDNKMANGTLSVMDGYLARHFLGIDLTAYFQVDMNLKNEFKNLKQYHDDFFSDLYTLEQGEYLLDKSQDLNTFANAASRKLHEITAGITHTSDENAQFNTAIKNYAYRLSKNIGGGRTTDAARKEALALTDAKFKDASEYRASIATTQDMLAMSMQNSLEKLQAANVPIPKEALERYERIMAKNRAVQENYNIDLREYNKKHGKQK